MFILNALQDDKFEVNVTGSQGGKKQDSNLRRTSCLVKKLLLLPPGKGKY